MKKTAIITTAAIFFSAITLNGLIVFADEPTTPVVKYTSKGQIEFKPSTKPIDPLDPTNPVNPIKPIDPTTPDGTPNPGTTGSLSIDFASSLDFGEQQITSKNKVYTAKAQAYLDANNVKKLGPNFVQVSDNRGLESGWTLKVEQIGQFESEMGKVLEGARITLNSGNVVTASNSPAPKATTKINLTPNSETTVMSAKKGQGAGTYLHAWGTDEATAATNIELFVPGSTTKYADVYETLLEWKLSDVPGNEEPTGQ